MEGLRLEQETMGFKSGYVTLVGRPNVGKSTLLNRLVARKLAAMSRRPQTTRNRITGVCHVPGGQIILLDTPGVHKTDQPLNRKMVQTAVSTFDDADLILLLISAPEGFTELDRFVFEAIQKSKTPVALAINKVDAVGKPPLLDLIAQLSKEFDFRQIVPISALKEDGLESLKRVLLDELPEGPPYFPEDLVTDCPEEFLTGEIIREKIIKLTHLEIPYSVAVVVEAMREGRQEGVTLIDATVYVEKASQKGILIGARGQLIKKVGTQARKELERRLGGKVVLSLFVKVKPGWRGNERSLNELVYPND
ncbi:MAG: GTPase Era [Nitrospina sp.]|nr:GTPase Era [Nitrospina sp.]